MVDPHVNAQRSPGRARLSDIAAYLGVSTATVSRVLNGKGTVAPDTRQSVLAALDVLGYERPESLQSPATGPVGIVTPELINPVFPTIAHEIESALSQRGHTPVLCAQSPGGATEDEYIEMLLAFGVQGLIFVSGRHADAHASSDRYLRLRDRDVPMVFVNGYRDGIDAPFLSTDDAVAIGLSVRHLASLGHTSIGLAVGPDRYMPSRRKVDSFVRALVEHGLAADADEARTHIVVSLFTVEGGQGAAEQLLASGHTAIICGSDLMALGAVRGARTRGLSVPGDVSVIGYDDSPLIAFTDPALTTVRQPMAALGQAAVVALMSEISGQPVPRAEMLFAPDLIVRASSGAAPGRH